jgi:hypothetical protein
VDGEGARSESARESEASYCVFEMAFESDGFSGLGLEKDFLWFEVFYLGFRCASVFCVFVCIEV